MAQYIDREMILEEARRLFARYGFRKTSLADIVRGLGVGKTAVYHHFPGGKSEIIDACLQREEEAILLKMRAAVDRQPDPRQQLQAMVTAKLEHITGLREVLAMGGEVGQELSQLYHRHERRFHLYEEGLIESILRRGQEIGVFRPADPQRLARGLRTLLDQLEIEIAFDSGTGVDGGRLDTIFDLMFHGLVNAEHREGSVS